MFFSNIMNARTQTKVEVKDALDYILGGNDSEIEDFSSDDDQDNVDSFVIEAADDVHDSISMRMKMILNIC